MNSNSDVGKPASPAGKAVEALGREGPAIFPASTGEGEVARRVWVADGGVLLAPEWISDMVFHFNRCARIEIDEGVDQSRRHGNVYYNIWSSDEEYDARRPPERLRVGRWVRAPPQMGGTWYYFDRPNAIHRRLWKLMRG
ncbi:MAG: hypothetical protein ACP5QE_06410 [Conexivisphaera sp.]